MSKSILHIRPDGKGYALVCAVTGAKDYVVAARIPREAFAKKFAAVPELIDAAIFAASVIKSNGMVELSEQMAYQYLEEALTAAGHVIDTPAIKETQGEAA
ncbi:hypothetical protein [Undibacterium sp. Ren11W]|uniref:hypothetical protein n=1 Tax=Undibacterium sp. Ren11W TaxID=3413045 RepID=UPI003BEF90C3